MHVVILAGGSGSRLWPLSREEYPKQFLTLGGPVSLLQETVRRFLGSYPLLVVTNYSYEALVKKQLAAIGAEGVAVLTEPTRRNTAPAIALSLRYLEHLGQKPESVLILPSDHLLAPKELFFESLANIESAIQRKKLVLFGIQPARAETGFGYMKIGKPFDEFSYMVERFVEKPDLKRATSFIQDPLYYWNSGMLAFSPSHMWELFEIHLPAISQLKRESWNECLENFYLLPDISIDYAVIEKTSDVVSCPLPIKWSDLGSWDLVYTALEKDGQLNVKIGDVLEWETKKCLFMGGEKTIAALGLEDVFVVDTKDILFVGKRGEAHKVRELLQLWKQRN